MVVGQIKRHSGNTEALRGIDIGHTRVQDLCHGQEVRIERRIKGFKLEEGTIEGHVSNTSLVFKPNEPTKDGVTAPWVVVCADEINKGNVRVSAVVETLGRVDSDPFVPVATDYQVDYASHFNMGVLDAIHLSQAQEGLLALADKAEQDGGLLNAA